MEYINKFTILAIFTAVFVAIYCDQQSGSQESPEAYGRLVRKVIPDEEAGNKTLKELNAGYYEAREQFLAAKNASASGSQNNATEGGNSTQPAGGGTNSTAEAANNSTRR